MHLRDDTDKPYVSRKERQQGLTSIEDWVDASIKELEDNIKKNKERLITAAGNSIGNTITDKINKN